MSSDIAISVKNLTKTYRIFGHPGDRIKQAFTFGKMRFYKEFTALQDVSFEIKKGETVGIIGRNGSGKSTLLQLICGILKPTSGTVQVNGRISALLELGAGFNPEFTGRENVFFQGAIMGFSKKEMERRFGDIASFADIGEFIDQPVRTYSSGMFMRLAFAVAVHVDPEVLVVDEALAVGDVAFQAKCFQRIKAIRETGGAILFVTHAAEQVAHFCDRALLIDRGILLAFGNTTEVLGHYVNLIGNSLGEMAIPDITEAPGITEMDEEFQHHPAYNSQETRWGDRAATITNVCLIQDGRENPSSLAPGLTSELRLYISFHAHIENPIYGLSIKFQEGGFIFSSNSRELLGPSGALPRNAGDKLHVCFSFKPFLDAGDYLISVGVASETASGVRPHDRRYDSIKLRIAHPLSATGNIDMDPSIRIVD